MTVFSVAKSFASTSWQPMNSSVVPDAEQEGPVLRCHVRAAPPVPLRHVRAEFLGGDSVQGVLKGLRPGSWTPLRAASTAAGMSASRMGRS